MTESESERRLRFDALFALHSPSIVVWLYATARRVIANQRRLSRRRLALHARSLKDLRRK